LFFPEKKFKLSETLRKSSQARALGWQQGLPIGATVESAKASMFVSLEDKTCVKLVSNLYQRRHSIPFSLTRDPLKDP